MRVCYEIWKLVVTTEEYPWAALSYFSFQQLILSQNLRQCVASFRFLFVMIRALGVLPNTHLYLTLPKILLIDTKTQLINC